MRKPRSDKKLSALSQEQQDKLWAWMGTPGLSYARIVTLVKAEFSLEISIRALSEWWEDRATEEQQERFLRATNIARDIGAQADSLPQITKALKSQLTQKAFEMSLSGSDVDDIKTLMSIVGGMNRDVLSEGALALEIDKFKNSLKSEQEKALDALFQDIKGNPEAVALFDQLRAAVMKTYDRKAD